LADADGGLSDYYRRDVDDPSYRAALREDSKVERVVVGELATNTLSGAAASEYSLAASRFHGGVFCVLIRLISWWLCLVRTLLFLVVLRAHAVLESNDQLEISHSTGLTDHQAEFLLCFVENRDVHGQLKGNAIPGHVILIVGSGGTGVIRAVRRVLQLGCLERCRRSGVTGGWSRLHNFLLDV
jgi:hypothetical protein